MHIKFPEDFCSIEKMRIVQNSAIQSVILCNELIYPLDSVVPYPTGVVV
jgi:hypothetical protein